MPELAHNMGLLVSLTEAQLRRMDASLQHQQDTATLLAQVRGREGGWREAGWDMAESP